MYNNSKVAKAIRLAMIVSASAAATISAPVFAAEADELESVERISVTGSRIKRAELSTPSPTLTINAQELVRFGNPDLGSMLAELPALGATSTIIGNNNDGAEAGVSSVDLRRLGTKRTLVLINGKRHVAGSPGSSQVDLSTIPAALIERVEVITGGASAIYGSDAVSGVVNVILKKDFDGLEFNLTGGNSTESVGNENYTFSVLGGTDIADGRGNITFFAGIEDTTEVMSSAVRQWDSWGSVINPDNEGEEDGVFDKFRRPNVGSEMINDFGVMNPFSGDRFTFDKSGNRQDACSRSLDNSFAFGELEASCGDRGFFGEQYENYIPGVQRTTVGSTINYEITENINFFGDFKYTRADIQQQFQPSFRFGSIDINVADNAFLSDEARAELGGTGTASMAKFFGELGNRSSNHNRELFRFVGGLDGFFSLGDTDVDYELFYIYGETSNNRVSENDLIPGNLAAGIDSVIDPATGQAVCRSQLESAQDADYSDPATVDAGSCVAYNPFGFAQSSPEALDWVSADVTRKDVIKQEVIGGSLAGDTGAFFELPGGAVGIAAGFEYRTESSSTITDELTKSGATTNSATPDEFGEYDVTEMFVEVSLPLISGQFLAEELTLDGAYRYSDYSHAGSVDAWKVGMMYAPIADLRFRGTYGAAVRAPNISEAFSPLSPGFARVSDPCDADNILDDPDRVSNCAALGIPVGFEANDNVSIDTFSGGNDELTPEESTSLTIGTVWTPSYLENFSITLDFYDIEIKDAIIEVESQDIADNCVDATGGPDAVYCGAVDRSATTYDIDLVRSGFLNASAYNTSGIDVEMRYNFALDSLGVPGELYLKLFVNKLLELEQFEFQDRPDEINVEVGETGDPELQASFSATYNLDDLSVTWQSRYIDRVVTYDVSPGGGSPEDLEQGYIPSVTTHDLSFNYIVSENVKVNAGLRNIFDKLPKGWTNDPLYDLVGRRAYAGVTVNF
ncbi:TonB-dependent receptor plug domain-containing protein [Colwellia psychrerythraea]|uniref:TonB-dependent receptor n=1 Tax=Colwellia psychrerythraea (strain 34H / ATCC BAA-681) TaxID=167879 RepID=Q47XP3_COLP3|nr:TonB-dependent receptor [Colwellia psychrerythraea]AAZ26620.1 TonB-dependent receptor [Colwellia psychrerythraea 34H]